MLGISKRENRYVRRLLIHGARSCVVHLDRTRDRLGTWIAKLQSRMHVNKVTVALAAKDRSHRLGGHQPARGRLRTSRSGDRLTR
jgi:transposase